MDVPTTDQCKFECLECHPCWICGYRSIPALVAVSLKSGGPSGACNNFAAGSYAVAPWASTVSWINNGATIHDTFGTRQFASDGLFGTVLVKDRCEAIWNSVPGTTSFVVYSEFDFPTLSFVDRYATGYAKCQETFDGDGRLEASVLLNGWSVRLGIGAGPRFSGGPALAATIGASELATRLYVAVRENYVRYSRTASPNSNIWRREEFYVDLPTTCPSEGTYPLTFWQLTSHLSPSAPPAYMGSAQGYEVEISI
jgi:hypothetical protein